MPRSSSSTSRPQPSTRSLRLKSTNSSARVTAGKTAVYISHRMSSCKFCDRIIVLDHGRIAEDGTHDTLLANHASTPIFTKPRPNTTPESSPSRPPQRKWESEKHNPWQFVLRTSRGCVFLAPLHLFQECKRLLIMNKMHQMIRTHNCYIFFL